MTVLQVRSHGSHCSVSLTGCCRLMGKQPQSTADPKLVPNATEATGVKCEMSQVHFFCMCNINGLLKDPRYTETSLAESDVFLSLALNMYFMPEPRYILTCY